jgi:hypothetical protein
VDYIIQSARRIYKDLEKNDISYSFAGIRPLYGNGIILGLFQEV